MTTDQITADPRTRLDQLIRTHGDDYASMSRFLGKNSAYVQQFIKRGTPRRLGEEDRRKLAQYYRVPERLLDEPDDMRDWAQRAIAVAKKDAAAKKKPKKRVSARAPEPKKETKPSARTAARHNNRTKKR